MEHRKAEPQRVPGADRQSVSHDAKDRPTRALVVHIERRGAAHGDRSPESRLAESRLAEAVGLARAIDVEVVGEVIVQLGTPVPASLMGRGKVTEIAGLVAEREIELVVVNAQLAPGQQRNLERAWDAKVLDRTGLILEIFGRRARTREGALQVEHAHLSYQKSRLVRSWTHLERQRGGFGFIGGPGETQIEADRRLIQERLTRIEKQLDKVKRTRQLHRKGRERVPYPIVALVGYTNAGKSTLFNALTAAGVDARDLLFATLDPTMRRVKLAHGREIIISDTVGFIADLPTTLIAAFRATLEEVLEADIILHVRDVAHEEAEAQAGDVDKVLDELGIDEKRRSQIIEVWNKADLLPPDHHAALAQAAERRPGTVLVSAVGGEGLDRLLGLIEERLAVQTDVAEIEFAPEEGADVAWLHDHGEVLRRTALEDGSLTLRVRLTPDRLDLARRRFGDRLRLLEPAQRAAAE
jgi:GTP-binding protein HflX